MNFGEKHIKGIPDAFYTKLAILWFSGEWDSGEIINDKHELRKYFEDILRGILFAEERILFQLPDQNKLLSLMKEFCLIPEYWSFQEIIANGEKMYQKEMERVFQHKENKDVVVIGGKLEEIYFASVQNKIIESYKTEENAKRN